MIVKYFSISTYSMIQYEYIEIIIIMKPDKIRLKYDLYNYMHSGYAYTQVIKGMYRLA